MNAKQMPRSSALKGKRLEAWQERETERVMESFSSVVNEAAEAEISYVTSRFRGNLPLLYAVSGLMKSDSLVALLDGRMKKAHEDQVDSATSQCDKGKVRRLLARCTKFKHLGADASMEKFAHV